ncbi:MULTISPECIES: SPFH domain-containing protein [Methylomicrobium]|uniref:Membrane protease subunit, stomatin/prohibitin n=1 Tax=Methylomicrobium album BG8 TaxID=686340 RepID=H8GHD7_METAL|nr:MULTISPECIES: SPFH domain-containing protein [Methylomicrobium]EIC30089.1 membrane protease subunit, stomatin/prohibitin [Methylomicrobium album BG8]
MLVIKYFKADASTFVIKTVNGTVRKRGKGLSFFYNAATDSIAAVPVNAQETPFIFKLLTADFQSMTVQGQVTYRVVAPEKMAEMLNYSLKNDGQTYVSEDPLKLADRVIRIVQSIVQNKVQVTGLREALKLGQTLVTLIREQLAEDLSLAGLGIALLDISISALQPTPETARALEAEAREAILKEADDAIYNRRKSAVEQERTIKEAELQTELSMQQKEQEIEESRLLNQRAIQRGQAETERERLQAEIAAETQRKELIALSSENSRRQADTEAYAITERMRAFRELPVENLKAIAMAKMEPEQLMALAFESLAQNAAKIGELTLTPDLFGHLIKKSVQP